MNTRNTTVRVHGILRCAKVYYCTCTHVTHFKNTAGLPVPVLNPTNAPPIHLRTFLNQSSCDDPTQAQPYHYTIIFNQWRACLKWGGRFAHFFPVAIQSAFTKLRDMMVSIANRLGGWDELTEESYCWNYQGNVFLCTIGSWVFNVFLVRTGR